MSDAETPEIAQLSDRLRELRDKKKDLESRTKDINAEIEETEADLVREMVNLDMQNFTRGGMMFYLTSKPYASPAAGQQEALYAWLKENGYGDLVRETVPAQSLSAFVREQMEESGEVPETLKPFVSVYEKVSIGMRKG